jgi:hypothetical protein
MPATGTPASAAIVIHILCSLMALSPNLAPPPTNRRVELQISELWVIPLHALPLPNDAAQWRTAKDALLCSMGAIGASTAGVRPYPARITCRLREKASLKLRVLLISQMEPQALLGDHEIVAVYPPVEFVGLFVQKPRSRLTHVLYRPGLRSWVQRPGCIPEAACGTGSIMALNSRVKFALQLSPEALSVLKSEDSILQAGQVFQRFTFPRAHGVGVGEQPKWDKAAFKKNKPDARDEFMGISVSLDGNMSTVINMAQVGFLGGKGENGFDRYYSVVMLLTVGLVDRGKVVLEESGE